MEDSIFKLILDGAGLALALAILFYYSYNSFKVSRAEKLELRIELRNLQTDFHSFKNDVIKKLMTLNENTKLSVDNLAKKIKNNF